jgi:hypothetical protein
MMKSKKWVLVLRMIDLVFIILKLLPFIYLLYRFLLASDVYVSGIYKHLILAFFCYFLLNICRIFLNRLQTVLILELFLNLLFVFYYGSNHLLFVAMTLGSILVVFLRNHVTENGKPNQIFHFLH